MHTPDSEGGANTPNESSPSNDSSSAALAPAALNLTATIFSNCLRNARGARSQAEFARFLGIKHQQTYQAYEAGRVPDGETLVQIATKLKISLDEMLIGKPAEPPPVDGWDHVGIGFALMVALLHDLHFRINADLARIIPMCPDADTAIRGLRALANEAAALDSTLLNLQISIRLGGEGK